MRQLVLGLLKPVTDSDLENQLRFQELRDYRFKIDKQLLTLEQTVFEKGEGVQIFDLLKRDIKDINKAKRENEKATE
jgi:chromosome segregation ATPase